MFAGGQADLRGSAKHGGKCPIGAHPRSDVFLRQLEKSEDLFAISLGDGRVSGPNSFWIQRAGRLRQFDPDLPRGGGCAKRSQRNAEELRSEAHEGENESEQHRILLYSLSKISGNARLGVSHFRADRPKVTPPKPRPSAPFRLSAAGWASPAQPPERVLGLAGDLTGRPVHLCLSP